MRAESKKISGRDERGDTSGRGAEGQQVDGRGICGPEEGVGTSGASDGQEGGAMALCAVRSGGSPIRRRGLR